MAILLGLGAALAYGAADFLGGLMSKRTSVLSVVLLSQMWGSLVLLVLFPIFLEGPFDALAVAWGAAAGVAGGMGVTLLYRALASGRMSVVAPVTAVVAASLPVLVGLATGERPAAIALWGVALGLAAVGLVSSSRDAPQASLSNGASKPELGPQGSGVAGRAAVASRAGVAEAVGAGLCFGGFFIFLKLAGQDTGLWPLLGARGGSFAVAGLAIAVVRPPLRPAPGSAPGIAGAGILDVLANVLYLLASRRGLLSLVAVLTSMYPASTVLLARLVLSERLQRIQMVGLGCAAVAASLIALG